MRVPVWMLLPLAACTMTEVDRHPSPLAPFVEACRFVPAGMTAIAFLHQWPGVSPFIGDADLYVWSGRDFERPRRAGIGPACSITISRFARGGATQLLRHSGLLASAREDRIGDQVCWQLATASDEEGAGGWFVIVDDEWLLYADRRPTLAAALLRSGDMQRLLQPFGDLSFLPEDASDLVFDLPRTGEIRDWGRPVPTCPMVFALTKGPWRLSMYAREKPHEDFLKLLRTVWIPPDPATTRVDAWMCRTGRLKDGQPLTSTAGGWLVLWSLMGYWVFV